MNPNRLHPKSTVSADLISRGPVVVWLTRDFRLSDNWAILYAQEKALELKVPLVLLIAIRPDLRAHSGTARMLTFWMAALVDLARAAGDKAIGFRMLLGDPVAEVDKFCKLFKASLLVTDFWPTQPLRSYVESSLGLELPVAIVDAHNIVPVWEASDKQEYAAYTFRPKIQRLLEDYAELPPKIVVHPHTFGSDRPTNFEALQRSIQVRTQITLPGTVPLGIQGANQVLDEFLANRVAGYKNRKNAPELDYTSHLSPYLHFGLLAPVRVYQEMLDHPHHPSEDTLTFIEELVVRRELADNFCFYQPSYNQTSGFPAWAQRTLGKHATDPREYVYSYEDLENAKTHDAAWNAAQKQMVLRGTMHGYMRMYWAKKILEWTESAEVALSIAIKLNDLYELDGRDPNGYTGISWSIGGVHDRPWFERPVYGQVRYMALSGLSRKFDLDAYIRSIR